MGIITPAPANFPIVSNQPIPPKFDPGEWSLIQFNCYAYAMRINMSFSEFDDFEILPGFISRDRVNIIYNSTDEILQYFKEDCEALGLNAIPTKMEDKLNSNEYKVAIYTNESFGVHFIRQDSNGKWSEKVGWCGKIKIIENENLITQGIGRYKFLQMFRISKK